MSNKITIKLTRKEKAAAKRLERWEKWVEAGKPGQPSPYDRHKLLCARDDKETLANAVLRARKGGAK